MPTIKKVPLFAQKGVNPPYNTVFAQMRDRWFAEAPEGEVRTNNEFAELLGVTAQRTSGWASTGESRRTAPSWAVMRLAHILGLGVAHYPDRIAIVVDPKPVPVDSEP